MLDDLEQMVDKAGLSKVLFWLSTICDAKADHLASNWQDDNAAKEWKADARAIDKLAAKIRTT